MKRGWLHGVQPLFAMFGFTSGCNSQIRHINVTAKDKVQIIRLIYSNHKYPLPLASVNGHE